MNIYIQAVIVCRYEEPIVAEQVSFKEFIFFIQPNFLLFIILVGSGVQILSKRYYLW